MYQLLSIFAGIILNLMIERNLVCEENSSSLCQAKAELKEYSEKLVLEEKARVTAYIHKQLTPVKGVVTGMKAKLDRNERVANHLHSGILENNNHILENNTVILRIFKAMKLPAVDKPKDADNKIDQEQPVPRPEWT